MGHMAGLMGHLHQVPVATWAEQQLLLASMLLQCLCDLPLIAVGIC